MNGKLTNLESGRFIGLHWAVCRPIEKEKNDNLDCPDAFIGHGRAGTCACWRGPSGRESGVKCPGGRISGIVF